jgi:hypothetical protein
VTLKKKKRRQGRHLKKKMADVPKKVLSAQFLRLSGPNSPKRCDIACMEQIKLFGLTLNFIKKIFKNYFFFKPKGTALSFKSSDLIDK